jgi:ribosomal protein S18 acetylase RimI-like enzyme
MIVCAIRPLTPADVPAIMTLQQAYTVAYSGATVIPGEIYLSPSFVEGRNVLCALNTAGAVCGYAPIFPRFKPPGAPGAHRIWVEVKADPARGDASAIKDALFAAMLVRAREIASAHPGDAAEVVFQYFTFETDSIAYVHAKGCAYAGGIFEMARDLHAPILKVRQPVGITVRRWKIETVAEQEGYIAAHNEALPGSALALGDFQYFLGSRHWAAGCAIAAFDGDKLVGCVSAYPDIDGNRERAAQIGFTEDVFVRPAWQGRGIGKYIIATALAYLREQGLDEACLQVSVANRNALRVYEDLGYRVMRESGLYSLALLRK